MSGRVDQFVAAMITGLPVTDDGTKEAEEIARGVVAMAIHLDKLIADHELKEIQENPVALHEYIKTGKK